MTNRTPHSDSESARPPRHSRAAGGFTLMEVMVAIGILAAITSVMWVSITNMFETRDMVKKRYQRFQLMRVAMDRLANEIAAAYTAGPQFGAERQFAADFPNRSGQSGTPTGSSGSRSGGSAGTTSSSQQQEQSFAFREPVQFGMVGESDELHFTSFAHVRTVEGERASHHAEIGYTVESVDRAGRELDNALVRREDVTLDDDITEGGTSYVMIPEVESIEFEYWDPGEVQLGQTTRAKGQTTGRGEWVSSWDTRDQEYYRRLPTRVRITVTLPPQRDRGEPETFRTQAYIMNHQRLEF